MSRLALFFSLLIQLSTAQAWQIKSEIAIIPQGQFQDTVTLFCRTDEILCQNVCQNQTSCFKEQEVCFNCLGTSNPVLRTVFTEINRIYRNSGKVLSDQEAIAVFRQDFIFVAARSIYNFYSALDNSEVLERFLSLCPNSPQQPMVALKKNLNNEPVEIKYVLCEGQGPQNQAFYALEYAPQVVTDPENLEIKNKP